MHLNQRSRPYILLVAGVAVGLAALGCNRAGKSSTEKAVPAPAATAAPSAAKPHSPEHVSLTGCLQEGNHGTYILAELNRPAKPDSSNPSIVAHEDLAAAVHAYRLNASKDQKLSKLVGRTIRVDGTLTEPSDLVASNPAAGGPVGTGGQGTETVGQAPGRREISQRDLAKVEVSSVVKIANVCGRRVAARSKKHHS